jgi:hypothetical protein
MKERASECGRDRLGLRPGDAIFRKCVVASASDVSEIKLVFSIPPHRPTPSFAASWSVAPTDPALSIVVGTLN